MAQRIAGTAFLKVDGNMLPLRGNFTVSPSAVERTFLAGQDYVHGYQELPRVPWIEGDVSSTPDVSSVLVGLIFDSPTPRASAAVSESLSLNWLGSSESASLADASSVPASVSEVAPAGDSAGGAPPQAASSNITMMNAS